MTPKTYLSWVSTRIWCMQHPEEIAAIITREGYFEITFRPKDILNQPSESFKTEEYGWIKSFFIE